MINSEILSSSLTDGEISTQLINYKLIRLVQHGFSNEGISHVTGLSHSQVQYRVRMYKLSGVRRCFRNGITDIADSVIAQSLTVSATQHKKDAAIFERVRQSILDSYKISTKSKMKKRKAHAS